MNDQQAEQEHASDGAPLVWLTTGATRDNGEPRGWRMHAVPGLNADTLIEVKRRRALCGTLSSHGWDIDLFIEKKCARCLRRAGLACGRCRGRGYYGSTSDGTWNTCQDCATTGELREGLSKRVTSNTLMGVG